MKGLAGCVVAVALSSGCASPPSEPIADRFETDAARMNAVERAAARTGVRVYWINAPRKPSKPVNG